MSGHTGIRRSRPPRWRSRILGTDPRSRSSARWRSAGGRTGRSRHGSSGTTTCVRAASRSTEGRGEAGASPCGSRYRNSASVDREVVQVFDDEEHVVDDDPPLGHAQNPTLLVLFELKDEFEFRERPPRPSANSEMGSVGADRPKSVNPYSIYPRPRRCSSISSASVSEI